MVIINPLLNGNKKPRIIVKYAGVFLFMGYLCERKGLNLPFFPYP
jgi:hypothetical protein